MPSRELTRKHPQSVRADSDRNNLEIRNSSPRLSQSGAADKKAGISWRVLRPRITDPAPVTPDLKPWRYRGVRCIRLFDHLVKSLASQVARATTMTPINIMRTVRRQA